MSRPPTPPIAATTRITALEARMDALEARLINTPLRVGR